MALRLAIAKKKKNTEKINYRAKSGLHVKERERKKKKRKIGDGIGKKRIRRREMEQKPPGMSWKACR